MIRWTGKSWGRLALALVFLVGLSVPAYAAKPGDHKKLDKVLNSRAGTPGTSRVVIMLEPGADASAVLQKLGGKAGRRLGLINGQAAELPNGLLKKLADHPGVASVHHDRPIEGELNRVAVSVGARAVQTTMGYRGAGVGVAVIDSGITSWHDDLTNVTSLFSSPTQRVAGFVDFVNGRTSPYDDNGHGTHVAGIIAGNGFDTLSVRAGIAPAAHVVSLKVLDAHGRGVISNVIAALDYAVQNRAAFNLRVVNLSVGARVTESYWTDPLTLAAKRANDAGLVVVAAAGNLGRNRLGVTQYGAITAPGNAPWVLTVGASDHNGTVYRYDDKMAGFSSRGPSAIDYLAKPDLAAPGVGIVSLSDPASRYYATKSESLLSGLIYKPYKPYVSLSGTSMSAPVVSGTVALMLEANPSLTPNLVKALLQYTAERRPGYNELTQGAGFLNAHGAVRLARFFASAQPGALYPSDAAWSKQLIWGNHRVTGGVVKPSASAWKTSVVWGAAEYCAAGDECENIVWGTLCADGDPACENIVWGSNEYCDPAADPGCENIVWGTDGEPCDLTVNPDCENIVWGTNADVCDPAVNPDCDNIVWGTSCDASVEPDCDNVVWGSLCLGDDCENIVWGTLDENIVWGSTANCDPAIDPDCDNIVWGSTGCNPAVDPDCDNLVWGTSDLLDENLVWGSTGLDTPLYDDPEGEPVNFDQTVFEHLFLTGPPDTSSSTAPQPDSSTTSTSVTVFTATGIEGGSF